MTERLYYTDPALTEFDATVTGVERHGDRPAVAPRPHGVLPDLGRPAVRHRALWTTRPSSTSSSATMATSSTWSTGDLPSARRVHGVGRLGAPLRSHAAAHGPAHPVGGVRPALAGARTVGFHLGAVVSTLDLDRELPPQAIAAAEAEANRVVWEDRPVSIRFVAEDGGRGAAAAQGAGPQRARCASSRWRTTTCRPAAARTSREPARSASSPLPSWEKLRGGSRSSSCAAGGRCRRSGVFATAWPAASGTCRLRRRSCRRRSSGCRRRTRTSARRSGRSRSGLRGLRGRGAGRPRRSGRAANAGWSRPSTGATQTALKAMAVAIAAKPGFQVALFSTSPPVLAVVARSKDSRSTPAPRWRRSSSEFGGEAAEAGSAETSRQGGGLTGGTSAADILAAAPAH